MTSASGADNSNKWSTTWCGHKSSFKKPPKKQGEKPKMFPLLSKKNQKDSELPLQIKSVQSLSDKDVISSKEGNPENDIGESDMQIQITSVQGNVGKLYQNHKDLLAKDDAPKANPIEIEGLKNAILQIKLQKTNKQTNQSIFKSNRFTDEQILNIIDEYTEQVDHISVIAYKYGVHFSTIRNWIEKGFPGVNNPFLIAMRHTKALRYNDKSVLENHHCAIAFKLLLDPQNDVFELLSEAQYWNVRSTIVTMIMSSDLSNHFAQISKYLSSQLLLLTILIIFLQ